MVFLFGCGLDRDDFDGFGGGVGFLVGVLFVVIIVLVVGVLVVVILVAVFVVFGFDGFGWVDGLGAFAGFEVPLFDRAAVVGAGGLRRIGADGNRPDGELVAGESAEAVARFDVPQFQRSIDARGEHAAAVGRKLRGADGELSGRECVDTVAGFDVPQLERFVPARGDRATAGGVGGDGGDPVAMAVEGADAFPGLVLQQQCTVARDEGMAAGGTRPACVGVAAGGVGAKNLPRTVGGFIIGCAAQQCSRTHELRIDVGVLGGGAVVGICGNGGEGFLDLAKFGTVAGCGFDQHHDGDRDTAAGDTRGEHGRYEEKSRCTSVQYSHCRPWVGDAFDRSHESPLYDSGCVKSSIQGGQQVARPTIPAATSQGFKATIPAASSQQKRPAEMDAPGGVDGGRLGYRRRAASCADATRCCAALMAALRVAVARATFCRTVACAAATRCWLARTAAA